MSPIAVALGSLAVSVGCEFAALLSEVAHPQRSAVVRCGAASVKSAIGCAVLGIPGTAVQEFDVLLAGGVLLPPLSSLCRRAYLGAGPRASEQPNAAETGLSLGAHR